MLARALRGAQVGPLQSPAPSGNGGAEAPSSFFEGEGRSLWVLEEARRQSLPSASGDAAQLGPLRRRPPEP